MDLWRKFSQPLRWSNPIERRPHWDYEAFEYVGKDWKHAPDDKWKLVFFFGGGRKGRMGGRPMPEGWEEFVGIREIHGLVCVVWRADDRLFYAQPSDPRNR